MFYNSLIENFVFLDLDGLGEENIVARVCIQSHVGRIVKVRASRSRLGWEN